MAKKNIDLEESMSKQYDACMEHFESARKGFLQINGVIGVGIGHREKNKKMIMEEPCLIVYVEEKKAKDKLGAEDFLPCEFKGVPLDVVVPGERENPAHNDQDFMWLDGEKIHAQNPDRDINLNPMADYNLDNVAVLEIDNSFLNGSKIDWVKVTKRFLASHPDAFDFITYYVDTSTGLSGQGSWHRGIYNKTKGINYYAGSNLNNRNAYGSQKLQAIHSIGWIGNQVLLQETGHMWGAFVRNRDTRTGRRHYDLLMGSTGQGLFHWGRFFDNDHSPMDYDGIDWNPAGRNRFCAQGVADDFFHFCPLDLYLMGLIPKNQVGSFYSIKNPSGNSGCITGTRKTMSVQNVIWAEGDRNPASSRAQKSWKQAFVVLTKDARRSRAFVRQVAGQRREFAWQFYKATRFLGKVDTTLRSYSLFPTTSNISVAIDNDRAIVGWKSNTRTKGHVNFATSPGAFRRDQAHNEPFTTVQERSFTSSHGIQLTGLRPNTTYYYEIIQETQEGLFERKGVEKLYTRKTNDTCAPDINNLKITRSSNRKVTVSWQTDEPCTSRVFYGTRLPLSQQKYDAYPTTSHRFVLGGLSRGRTYYISVESRDAAGNVTTDNSGGRYFRIAVPSGGGVPADLAASNPDEIIQMTDAINENIEAGNMSNAIEQTSQLIMQVATQELDEIMSDSTVAEGDLDGSYDLLEVLVDRLDGVMSIVDRGDNFIDFAIEGDPLQSIACVHMPGDLVAQESGFPVLSEIISKVNPALSLEPHSENGMGHYRLSLA